MLDVSTFARRSRLAVRGYAARPCNVRGRLRASRRSTKTARRMAGRRAMSLNARRLHDRGVIMTIRNGVRRAAFVALVGSLALALGACGGQARRINSPMAKIQQLAAQPDGTWALTLRLHNFSNIPMRFVDVVADFEVDGARAGEVHAVPAMDIPPESADVVHLTLAPTVAARDALAKGTSDEDGVPYRLEGTIMTANPDGSFEFEHESTLTAVPGRPGEFR
jgi:hypothetical protein